VELRVQKHVEAFRGSHEVLEAMVLVEGLYAALALRICSVSVVTDHNLLHSPLVRYPLIPHLFYTNLSL
jgi:hypothetical protein